MNLAISKNPGGGKPDKRIRDSLLAALRQDPDKLNRASEKVWQMACDGDLAAYKEIADRLDGKAVQPIANDGEDSFKVAIEKIQRTVVDPSA